MKSICGIECGECWMKDACKGCAQSGGCPFGTKCMIASLYQKSAAAYADFKKELLDAVHALGIPELEKVSDLNALKGSFVNMELPLPNGQKAKFWNDDAIYLGNQVEKYDSDRCYGIAADEKNLMVCEYGENGADAQLVIFKRWR